MQHLKEVEDKPSLINEFGMTYAETIYCINAVRELKPKDTNEVIESIIKFNEEDPHHENIPEKLQSLSTEEIEELWKKINVYEEARKNKQLQYTDDLMNHSGLMPQGLPHYFYLPAGSYDYTKVATVRD